MLSIRADIHHLFTFYSHSLISTSFLNFYGVLMKIRYSIDSLESKCCHKLFAYCISSFVSNIFYKHMFFHTSNIMLEFLIPFQFPHNRLLTQLTSPFVMLIIFVNYPMLHFDCPLFIFSPQILYNLM